MTAELPAALVGALRGASRSGEIALAYSGGLDSRFLAFSAKKAGLTPLLYHVRGPHVAPAETRGAIDRARETGLSVTVVPFDPSVLDLARAGRARCYVCKKTLFTELMRKVAQDRPGLPLCDGTNASDLTVFRPGRKALEELGVLSPLAEAGLSKADIRRIGAAIGLPAPDQAARPCLLTRFPYGVTPSREALETVADVEAFLEALPEAAGLRYRLRYPAGRPELHWEKCDALTEEKLGRIALALNRAFPDALRGLTMRSFETLSGYYDRPNP